MSDNNIAEFKVIPNGPIRVRGNFVIKDTKGNVISSAEEVYLCRCGGTKNTPFCDGTHHKIGVRD